MKRELRNHLLILALVAAIIVPAYFVPAINRVVSPFLAVLQVLAGAVHILILAFCVLLLIVIVWAKLYWRRADRRAARGRDEWLRRRLRAPGTNAPRPIYFSGESVQRRESELRASSGANDEPTSAE